MASDASKLYVGRIVTTYPQPRTSAVLAWDGVAWSPFLGSQSFRGTVQAIAVDGPKYAKTRARWQQIHAVKKWGALLFVGAILFFTAATPWTLSEAWQEKLDGVLLPIQILICCPTGAIFYYLVMKEFHGELDDPPRRRRSGTSSTSTD